MTSVRSRRRTTRAAASASSRRRRGLVPATTCGRARGSSARNSPAILARNSPAHNSWHHRTKNLRARAPSPAGALVIVHVTREEMISESTLELPDHTSNAATERVRIPCRVPTMPTSHPRRPPPRPSHTSSRTRLGVDAPLTRCSVQDDLHDGALNDDGLAADGRADPPLPAAVAPTRPACRARRHTPVLGAEPPVFSSSSRSRYTRYSGPHCSRQRSTLAHRHDLDVRRRAASGARHRRRRGVAVLLHGRRRRRPGSRGPGSRGSPPTPPRARGARRSGSAATALGHRPVARPRRIELRERRERVHCAAVSSNNPSAAFRERHSRQPFSSSRPSPVRESVRSMRL